MNVGESCENKIHFRKYEIFAPLTCEQILSVDCWVNFCTDLKKCFQVWCDKSYVIKLFLWGLHCFPSIGMCCPCCKNACSDCFFDTLRLWSAAAWQASIWHTFFFLQGWLEVKKYLWLPQRVISPTLFFETSIGVTLFRASSNSDCSRSWSFILSSLHFFPRTEAQHSENKSQLIFMYLK